MSTSTVSDGLLISPTSTQRAAGPLTTVFTTPDICKSIYWTDVATPPVSSSICMPNGWKRYWDYGFGFYSPGICPSGYTEGCAFPASLATVTLGTPMLGGPLITGETARMCCPTGYTCYSGNAASYSQCIATSSLTTFWDFKNTVTTTQITTLALAFGVQVRWQQSDLSILQTNPTVPGLTFKPSATSAGSTGGMAAAGGPGTGGAVATVTGPGGTVQTVTDVALAANTSIGGMPRMATIGIAVAIPTLSLILGTLAFFLWRRHYRRKEAQKRKHQMMELDATPSSKPGSSQAGAPGGGRNNVHGSGASAQSLLTVDSPLSPHAPTEMDASSTYGGSAGVDTMSEMEGTTLAEMLKRKEAEMSEMEAVDTMKPAELPSSSFVAELEGDMPQPPTYREKERI